jgi:hypothetical protein
MRRPCNYDKQRGHGMPWPYVHSGIGIGGHNQLMLS